MTDHISFPPLHDPAPGEIEKRKRHLLSEISRKPSPPRLSLSSFTYPSPHVRVHRRLAIVVGLAIAAGAVAAGMALTGGNGNRLLQAEKGAQPPLTLARPLGPTATQIPLANAAATLGGPVVLPDSSLANSSDLGSVWARTVPGHEYDLAITFPSSGIIVQYDRPVPYPEPPAQMYQTEASQNPDSLSAIQLSGVPALATQQNSDQLGSNFGSIEFVAGGTRIAVLGHYDESTLEDVAQSIIAQASS